MSWDKPNWRNANFNPYKRDDQLLFAEVVSRRQHPKPRGSVDPLAEKEEPVPTTEIGDVLAKSSDGRLRWLQKVMLHVDAGRLKANKVYDIVAHPKFAKGASAEECRQMHAALLGRIEHFSQKQRRFILSDANALQATTGLSSGPCAAAAGGPGREERRSRSRSSGRGPTSSAGAEAASPRSGPQAAAAEACASQQGVLAAAATSPVTFSAPSTAASPALAAPAAAPAAVTALAAPLVPAAPAAEPGAVPAPAPAAAPAPVVEDAAPGPMPAVNRTAVAVAVANAARSAAPKTTTPFRGSKAAAAGLVANALANFSNAAVAARAAADYSAYVKTLPAEPAARSKPRAEAEDPSEAEQPAAAEARPSSPPVEAARPRERERSRKPPARKASPSRSRSRSAKRRSRSSSGSSASQERSRKGRKASRSRERSSRGRHAERPSRWAAVGGTAAQRGPPSGPTLQVPDLLLPTGVGRGCDQAKLQAAQLAAARRLQVVPVAASAVRPGDWFCPICSAHNYASKFQCFRCIKGTNPLLDGSQGLHQPGGFSGGGFSGGGFSARRP